MLADLGYEKISKLFWQYVIPSVLTMTALSLYYLIDSIYVGHGPGLGDHAIGGMGIVLPVINILGAIGTLVTVGTVSRISLYWGAGDTESAYKVMGTSILFVILLSLIPAFLIWIFADPLLNLMGAKPDTFAFAKEFMIFYLPAAVIFNLTGTLTAIIRVTGYPRKSMILIAVGVVGNLFVAPLYIFVFKWGMMGAALATFTATFITLVLCVMHFMDKKVSVRIRKQDIRLDGKIMWTIANIGLASFIMLAFNSLSILLTNNRLSAYGGSVALESYVIANRITFIFIMIITGLSQGIQPIVGFNYGARSYGRVTEVLKYAFKIGFLVGGVGVLIGFVFGRPIVSIFNPTDQLADQSAAALRILTITLPLSAFQMITGSFFQNIAMPVRAVLLNLSRQIVFLAPMLFILPLFWGLKGVWMSLPLSEVFASILYLIVLFQFYKQAMQRKTQEITI